MNTQGIEVGIQHLGCITVLNLPILGGISLSRLDHRNLIMTLSSTIGHVTYSTYSLITLV